MAVLIRPSTRRMGSVEVSSGARYNHGAGSSMAGLDPLTLVMLVNPASGVIGSATTVVYKDTSSTTLGGFAVNIFGSPSSFRFIRKAGTSQLDYRSSDTFLTEQDWWWLIARMDTGDGTQICRLYHAPLLKPRDLAECTYSLTTDPVGALSDDSSYAFYVGASSSGSNPWAGRIEHVSLWDDAWTIDVIYRFITNPNPRFGGRVPRVFSWYGQRRAALDVLDISGYDNDGVATGSPVLAKGPPVLVEVRPTRWATAAGAISQAVGIALETDTAFGVTALKALGVGRAAESDVGLVASAQKALAAGQALEADTGFAVTHSRAASPGQALEADAALAVGHAKAVTLSLATEGDTALNIGRLKTASIGLAGETDEALAVSVAGSGVVGLATENDVALAISAAKSLAVSIASESDLALALAPLKVVALGQAAEVDTALAVAIQKSAGLGIAIETDTALVVVPLKALAVGLASETDLALGVALPGIVILYPLDGATGPALNEPIIGIALREPLVGIAIDESLTGPAQEA